MREILFRGKRIDNGEWVEGQLLFFKASVGEENFALIIESCEWDNSNEWFNLCKRAKVIPETIGQYTGLTDKNGKKDLEPLYPEADKPQEEIAPEEEFAAFFNDAEFLEQRNVVRNNGRAQSPSPTIKQRGSGTYK